MSEWGNEDVSAYLDGALDAEAEAAFAAALADDPRLRARVEALAAVNRAVGVAFDAPLREPVPDRFLQMIAAAVAGGATPQGPEGASEAGQVIDLASRRAAQGAAQTPSQPHKARPASTWRLPMAAGFALVVGLMGGYALRGPGAPATPERALLEADAAVISSTNPLFALLDATPSAQTAKVGADGVFRPVVSFAAADGRLCREFEVGEARAMAVGVACRAEDLWRLEILVAAADRPTGEAGYATASGFDAGAIEGALARLGAGESFDAAQEQAAIAAGWRK